MKKDINLFGEEFEKVIIDCRTEELSVKKIEKEYKKALDSLEENNKKRIKFIKSIRNGKIKEIDNEKKECELALQQLDNLKQQILEMYCEKNGHKNILMDYEYHGRDNKHTFHGYLNFYSLHYKCEVCGKEDIKDDARYGRILGNQKYEQKIPQEIYEDETLQSEGKTLKQIEEEIVKIKEYKKYLKYLRKEICKLFGHDASPIFKSGSYEDFRCKCCGKTMDYIEYIDSHHNAKYRGIVKFYYENLPDKDYLIFSHNKKDLVLPTYESYQKILKK